MTAKNKAVGDDCFGMKLLDDEHIRQKAFYFLLGCINDGYFPKHWRVSRACFLSKDGNSSAEMGEARMIKISTALVKISENMILKKLTDCRSAIVDSGPY